MTDTEKATLERRIDELCAEVERLRQERREYQATIDSLVDECADHKAENIQLREALAISVPLPLDDNCCAVHPDDVIGYNVDGKDFFWKVKEMCLTRYPKKGEPVLWVVRTVNEEGKESPRVCWGGRCRAVHKVLAQTYSPEYLETYDENKQLKAENKELREFATQMANALGIDSEWCDTSWCDSDCMDEFKCRPTGDYGEIHCPAFAVMRELGIEVPS